jgi:hypothetical protein
MQAECSEAALLRQLEERLLHADVRKSAQALADLLADDFIEFGSSGRVFNKRQIIESLQHEPATPRTLMDFRTSVLAPGVRLVTYRAIRHGGADGQPMYSLRSSIWKLIAGRWQMVFHQGTPAPEP